MPIHFILAIFRGTNFPLKELILVCFARGEDGHWGGRPVHSPPT